MHLRISHFLETDSPGKVISKYNKKVEKLFLKNFDVDHDDGKNNEYNKNYQDRHQYSSKIIFLLFYYILKSLFQENPFLKNKKSVNASEKESRKEISERERKKS